MVDDGSEKDEGLLHEVGQTLVRQTEAIVGRCVEAVQSTFQTAKGVAENWATYTATLLRNATTDVKNTLSMLCCLGT